MDFYRFLLRKQGIGTHKGSRWGSHVSFIKGYKPPKSDLWGKDDGVQVEFWYTNQIRWDNGSHAWLDVWSPDLCEIRQSLGLEKVKMSYHLTLGRLHK